MRLFPENPITIHGGGNYKCCSLSEKRKEQKERSKKKGAKSMRRKLLACMMTVILGAGLLAGCGSAKTKEDAEKNTGTETNS